MKITEHIIVPEEELQESFIRSSGPGGQNANKLSTAVQLRFNLRETNCLQEAVKERAAKLAGGRMSRDGDIIIESSRFRSQELNRKDARERLKNLLLTALTPPKKRISTRPTYASKQKRLAKKTMRSETKKGRSKRPSTDW